MYTTKSFFTRANYEVNQTTCWKMMSDDQCEEIVMTAFELLERTGADVKNSEARALLKQAGCLVKDERVRFPSAKLEWALRAAPSRVTLCDRNGDRAVLMETDNVHYGPSVANEDFIDIETGEIRKFTKADIATMAKLCANLENIDFVTAFGKPSDVPAEWAPVHSFEALVNNTAKPIMQPVQNKRQAEAIIDMATAVKGSAEELAMDPFVALYVPVAEPLVHGDDALGAVMAAAKAGVPCVYANTLISGLTAPESSAGALVVALANALVGLLVAQLVKEGAPVIAGGFFTYDDTINELYPLGAPEVSLMGAGFTNVLRYLKVPSLGYAGGTDSKITDAQEGLESAFSLLHAGLAGTNMIYGAGQMESGLLGSPYLLVLSDEVIGVVKRIMSGVEVNEDRLARGIIEEVQPGGHYLGEPHTMYYFRNERYWPKILNRLRIDDWTAAGGKTVGQKAAEKTKELFLSGKANLLPAEVSQKLADIVAKQ